MTWGEGDLPRIDALPKSSKLGNHAARIDNELARQRCEQGHAIWYQTKDGCKVCNEEAESKAVE